MLFGFDRTSGVHRVVLVGLYRILEIRGSIAGLHAGVRGSVSRVPVV